jgi:ArsR family transcriptional regulator, arsenate/arsenite/antimonite-responsive transcriptional repressor
MATRSNNKTPVVTLEDVAESFRICGPVFHALGDKFRQDILLLLAQHERLNVNQITEHIDLSRPAVSHHLKTLLQAGLVQMDRESRENFYSLTIDAGLKQLRVLVERAEVSCT